MLDASARPGILKPIRLVIVDRQPIVLQGLKSILGTQQDFDVVASVSDGPSCLEAIRNLSPDVALIADTLPDLTPSGILAIAKAENLPTRLVFFAESDSDRDLAAAIGAGACSAISKYAAPGTMLQSLRLMAKSGVALGPSDLSPIGKEADGGGQIEKMLELLTPRERQIARLVSEGMSNKEIARRLDVSQGTIKVHLHNIFEKLEITNRTVLATISWLQRTSGFGALAVGFLAFAIADELRAAEADHILADDDGRGQTDEHAGFEVWQKAILQHLIVSKSGETSPFTERDLLAKASQAANPAAAMEALRAAEQFLGSKPWKDGVAIGSGTPGLPALLPRGSNDPLTGSIPPWEDHLPRLVSNHPSIHAGYGTFAALAGALIYELSDAQHGAQAHEPDQASIDSFLAGIADNATTKLAAITHVVAEHADNAAADVLSRDVGPHSAFVTPANSITQDGVPDRAAPDAAGDNVPIAVGELGSVHEPGPGGHGLDQQLGGNFENVVDRFPTDSRSATPDSIVDAASGPGRLNLAAFGALAWLHLTAAAKSIPPHTLAWIYDPESNQTIVYVNPTDRILDIGDRGLTEIHLQGIVAVAEPDLVQQSEGAVHAATLEQLEQALLSSAETDDAALRTNSSEADEDSLAEAGVWRAFADDGLSFQFAQVRTGSATSAESSAFRSDTADAAGESAGAPGVSAYGSSVAPGHSAMTPAAENRSAKSEPTPPNNAAPMQQSEMVQPGSADGTGHGHSEHTPEPGSPKAEMAQAEARPGNGAGHGHEQHSHAPDSAPGAAKSAESGGAEHGNSGHAASPKAAEAGGSAAPPGHTEHGHARQAGESGPAAGEMADAKPKPDNGVGNDHQAPDSPPGTTKKADTGGVEHGKSDHAAFDKGEEAGKSAAPPGHTEHGHARQAGEAGSAKAGAAETADAKSKPDNGVGHDHEHHSRALDTSLGVAKKAEAGDAEHGNPGHSTSAKGADAADSAATHGNTDHGNPQRAAHSNANPSEAAHPAKAAFEFGSTDQQPVFRFDGKAVPSTLVAVIEPKEPADPHMTRGQKDASQTIADIFPDALDGHAAHHGANDPHHGVGSALHDWLI